MIIYQLLTGTFFTHLYYKLQQPFFSTSGFLSMISGTPPFTDFICSETLFLLFSLYNAAAQRLIGVTNALLGYLSCISLVIFSKASLTLVVSRAEVSMNEILRLDAKKAASCVDTVCCVLRSILLPTNSIIMSLFPFCFNSLIQKSTLAKVEYLVISYTTRAPTAPL